MSDEPVQTEMRLSQAEDWPVTHQSVFRRVGWLDQKGRVWMTLPPPDQFFDGGSLTPLLFALDD